MTNTPEEYISQSFGVGGTPIELNKHKLSDVVPKLADDASHSIEANTWLPFAASVYKLSRDIRDYVLVPVPVMISELPNTNGDSVTLKEMLKFNPDMGMQAFKTFRGKPCHQEHDNRDHSRAKGVILDVFIRPIRKFGNGRYYKLVELMAYDRSKDPLLVNSLLSGENNAYSVGFYYKSYTCSICGKTTGQTKFGSAETCDHTFLRRKPYATPDGRLSYRQCHDMLGFETSVVADPAFKIAVGPHIMNAHMF